MQLMSDHEEVVIMKHSYLSGAEKQSEKAEEEK